MKNLALLAAAAAVGLFVAAAPLHAQNTQNAQDPAATAPAAPKTDRATRTTVRRSTKRATTGQTTQVTQTTQANINARNNARLNARLRTTERASVTTTVQPARLDGGVVRAVRSDNPLQAINPAAPAEYGSGQDVARHEPDDPFQRPQGLKLLVVEF